MKTIDLKKPLQTEKGLIATLLLNETVTVGAILDHPQLLSMSQQKQGETAVGAKEIECLLSLASRQCGVELQDLKNLEMGDAMRVIEVMGEVLGAELGKPDTPSP